MSFSKIDLDKIKSKISIKDELEKKTKIIQKGKDYWCCCPFHDEKTPSCKINEDRGSFYCFGCGAKGDIFSLYTDLYNYSFIDAVRELSSQSGIIIDFDNIKKDQKDNKIQAILEISCEWFQSNLNKSSADFCNEYLRTRNLNDKTINKFRLGYSYNSENTLYNFLKKKNYTDSELIESNVVKLDKNKKIRDYFYKRLIFPILDVQSKVVGFGGRALDESNPKYINSPESKFFQKRYMLYNLGLAKNFARKKNNLLICEGYMDVISLYQNGINSVVAPLGTALTEDQLNLAWRYSTKPSIMFDGDNAGIRASYKSAITALPFISNKKFLQYITLPEGFDPDTYINKKSFTDFIKILKKPVSLINFIFTQSSKTLNLIDADEKISFDKYLDDLVEMIKDQKTKYFYRSELKSLFFEKIRSTNNSKKIPNIRVKKNTVPLNEKQILSFIAGAINHSSIRILVINELVNSMLLNKEQHDFLKLLTKKEYLSLNIDEISKSINNKIFDNLIKKCLDPDIFILFPYSGPKFDSDTSLIEISKSIKNLNTRLSNLKKINKSLDNFVKDSTSLNWNELQSINLEIEEED